MKTIFILRHAKSSWDDLTLIDFDRPLNKRGKREAPLVGEWLRKEDRLPGLILSSAAKRAVQTVKALVKAAGYEGEVEYEERFYDAGIDDWLQALASLPEDVDPVLLVGHNPTLEELVYALCRTSVTLQTATLAEIDLPIDYWAELGGREAGKLVQVLRPAKL